jgi:hypothetical protein
LQIPLLVGLVVNPWFRPRASGAHHRDPAEIIYHRRVQVLDWASQTNVTEACRILGVSRTTYYRWPAAPSGYGLARCCPRCTGRRPCRPRPHPTRSSRCWPMRSTGRPWAPASSSITWPTARCACEELRSCRNCPRERTAPLTTAAYPTPSTAGCYLLAFLCAGPAGCSLQRRSIWSVVGDIARQESGQHWRTTVARIA